MVDKFESQVHESKHIFMEPILPITLKFEYVVYKIKVKSTQGGLFSKKEALTEREILKGVFRNCQARRNASNPRSIRQRQNNTPDCASRLGGSLAGDITYNNNPFSNSLKRSIGFVTQDDVHYANLTVTETLVYTALLRLPNTLNTAQKIKQAESMVDQLDLIKCKDSVIGGPVLRGVSGGERKRVSIGQEMLVNPSLLLLDEPTSGLDSTTAQKIVSTLAELAKGGTGRTVLVTIHPPSSKLFYMFDKVLLLSDGSPLYFGRGGAVMDYFRCLGFAPLLAMNPADFLVDLAKGVPPDDSAHDQEAVKSILMSAYRSDLMSKVKSECEDSTSDLITEMPNGKEQVAKWATTWYQQFSILLQRGLKERRHQAFNKLRIFSLQSHFFQGCYDWTCVLLHNLLELHPGNQRHLHFPTRKFNANKGKILWHIQTFILLHSPNIYFMAGLKNTPGAFLYSLFFLLLNVMVSQGLGLALGAVFMNQRKASVFSLVLMLGFQLASGYYVQNVPWFISWIKYLSFVQYTFKLLLGSQYGEHDTYPCGLGTCLVRDSPSVKAVGLGMQMFSWLMLLAMFFLYRGTAYVTLTNCSKNLAMENISMAVRLRPQAHESKPIFIKPNRPVTLKFKDVVYKIKLKPTQNGFFNKKSETETETEILKGISGIVRPGEMLALLGPSGSGKTTLLTALGGRLGGHLGGSVTYNGKPFTNNLKRTIGFVTQDDVLYAHLTVNETLVYTALLRLPNTFTADQKIKQAESVIAQLNLTKCKNSVIGGPFLRGVSGGERKRVSIGQEMLINPSLLFLDEPTSGLDSTTAQTIVSTLSDLAKGGRTVLTTIHQPSSRLFYMFDKVLLLSDGNPLFFGNGDAVMDYFQSVGFAPSLAVNPADFLLDLANGITPDDSIDDQEEAAVKSKLTVAYKTDLDTNVKSEFEFISDFITESSNDKDETEKWATTWYQQFTVLLERGIKERKHEAFSKINIIQILLITLLSGMLWWKSKYLEDQIGLLFFFSSFWTFYPLFNAMFAFPPERSMLTKERSSGTYRLSSYFIAQTISDLPMELLLPTTYLIIVYFMAGLKPTPAAFFYTLFSLLLCVMVSQGIGLALGAVFMDQQKATVLGTVLTLGFQLAGGFYVQKVPAFIGWIKYLSVMQYAYKLMLGSQYGEEETYPCGGGDGECLVREFGSVKAVGLGMQMFSAVMLVAMLVLYRCVAYVALMRIGVAPN
ncbi:LOW QUALITY PROTEIN: hypothetical protein V2J09_023759 [Rumex salicifolius]